MLTYFFEDVPQDPKTLSPPVTGPWINLSEAETERPPSRSSTPTSLTADSLLHSGIVCLTGKKTHIYHASRTSVGLTISFSLANLNMWLSLAFGCEIFNFEL